MVETVECPNCGELMTIAEWGTPEDSEIIVTGTCENCGCDFR